MLTKIWERHFLAEFLKTFLLFIFCFYGLYVLIDYASHTSALPHHQIQIHGNHIIRYYFYVFASRVEILVPIALLIAFIKTVSRLNTDCELLALMASGQHLRTLLRPFVQVALLCVALIYLNEQFILPNALRKLRRIEDSTKTHKNHLPTVIAAKNISFEDGTLLLYQSYDPITKSFFDVYWVKSIDHLYRIKYLYPYAEKPLGKFVDEIIRQSNGELLQQASYTELQFPLMHFNREILTSTDFEPDLLPLKQLTLEALQLTNEKNERESKLLAAAYWKWTIPWLCLFAVLLPAPYCVNFSRNFHVFLIYVGSLCLLITFYLYLDAIQIVVHRQVVQPFWAIFMPYVCVLSWSGWRYFKLA